MYTLHVTVGDSFIKEKSNCLELDEFLSVLKEHYPLVESIEYNVVTNKRTAPMFTCRKKVTSEAESHLINNLIEDARDLFVMWLKS